MVAVRLIYIGEHPRRILKQILQDQYGAYTYSSERAKQPILHKQKDVWLVSVILTGPLYLQSSCCHAGVNRFKMRSSSGDETTHTHRPQPPAILIVQVAMCPLAIAVLLVVVACFGESFEGRASVRCERAAEGERS